MASLRSSVMGIFLISLSFNVEASSLLDMSDQLDKVDHQEFQSELDKANNCTRIRNFFCSEEELRKAAKMASSSSDKIALNVAVQNLQSEKIKVEEEARARAERERQMRLAEERRQEQIRLAEERRQEAEERRQEDEQREARRRQREQEEADDSRSRAPAGKQFLDQFQASLNDMSRQLNANNQQTQQLYAQALQQRREEQRAAQREADQKVQDEADRRERARRIAATERRNDEIERERRTNFARKQEEDRQREQDRQQEQARQQEKLRQQEQAKQQEKLRQQEQAKQQEQEKKIAEGQYLGAMARGIRLGVKNCYGQYEVGGTMPHIKPEVVSCIDVHYRAKCTGSSEYYYGVHKNFIGNAGGCFGDTSTMNPKPSCAVSELRVEVVEVEPCKF